MKWVNVIWSLTDEPKCGSQPLHYFLYKNCLWGLFCSSQLQSGHVLIEMSLSACCGATVGHTV